MKQYKILNLTAVLCMAMAASLFMIKPLSANASEDVMTTAPNVAPAHLNPEYWIAKNPFAENLIMDGNQINNLNKRIMDAGKDKTGMMDVNSLPQTFNGKEMVAELSNLHHDEGLFLNGAPLPDVWHDMIAANIINAQVSEKMALRYGFVVNETVVRDRPYIGFISDSADDPEWDFYSSTGLFVGEPIVVYFYTADNLFAYIGSKTISGYVPASDIAVCKDKAQWQNAKVKNDFLVVTGDKIYLETSLTYPESSEKMLSMGTVLKLVKNENGTVENRATWNNYVVKLPYRLPDGSFGERSITIPANRDVSVGYLPFTSAGIIRQAFKCLGNRYGWGDMIKGHDCSSFAKNVYKCFGLDIPRNTSWQANIPVNITQMGDLPLEQKYALIAQAFPGAIVQFPGHEVIFLGEENGKLYCINDVSSIGDPAASINGVEKIPTKRIRSVIVNDMANTRRANTKTWLEETNRIIEVWK